MPICGASGLMAFELDERRERICDVAVVVDKQDSFWHRARKLAGAGARHRRLAPRFVFECTRIAPVAAAHAASLRGQKLGDDDDGDHDQRSASSNT